MNNLRVNRIGTANYKLDFRNRVNQFYELERTPFCECGLDNVLIESQEGKLNVYCAKCKKLIVSIDIKASMSEEEYAQLDNNHKMGLSSNGYSNFNGILIVSANRKKFYLKYGYAKDRQEILGKF